MGTPYLSEIRVMSFNFAPKGWAQCNGQLLPINQNQALFSLLGTQYGGDGRVTFALPNLQGSVAIHVGGSMVQGGIGGAEQHTLVTGEMPVHNHTMLGNSATATVAPAINNYAATAAANPYSSTGASLTAMAGTSTTSGGGQGHENRQPYLTLNFCIALQGIYPSRN